MFGMATGWSPGFIMTEYSTSYTSHKGAFNDDLKHIMQDRATFIRIVDTVVNLEYLKHFILSGQLRVNPAFWSDYRIRRAYLEGTVLGPVPGHINPLQEINADIKANEAGALTKSQMSAKYGNDFWKMLSEWQSQQEAWSEASPAKRAEALAADVEAQQDSQDRADIVQGGRPDEENDNQDGPEARKRTRSIFSRRREK
jgi:capsid protein